MITTRSANVQSVTCANGQYYLGASCRSWIDNNKAWENYSLWLTQTQGGMVVSLSTPRRVDLRRSSPTMRRRAELAS